MQVVHYLLCTILGQHYSVFLRVGFFEGFFGSGLTVRNAETAFS